MLEQLIFELEFFTNHILNKRLSTSTLNEYMTVDINKIRLKDIILKLKGKKKKKQK